MLLSEVQLVLAQQLASGLVINTELDVGKVNVTIFADKYHLPGLPWWRSG